MAAWVAGALPSDQTISFLDFLKSDTAPLTLYREGVLEKMRICDLVAKLVKRLD
jgi:hypothetical protein